MATIQTTMIENIWKQLKQVLERNPKKQNARRNTKYVIRNVHKAKTKATLNRMLYGF